MRLGDLNAGRTSPRSGRSKRTAEVLCAGAYTQTWENLSSTRSVYCFQHRHLNLESWLSDATEDDISFVSQTLFGLAQLDLQLREALAAEVLQLHILQMLPDPLLGVEIGRVAGQLLQLQPPGRPASQKIFDRSTAMYRRSVPDEEQFARDLPQEVPQEADHIRTLEGPLLLHRVEFALHGDGADHGQMIARKLLVEDGRLTHRGVGAHYRRQKVKPRLVHKQDSPALLHGPFLSSSQRSSFQRLIASSSR